MSRNEFIRKRDERDRRFFEAGMRTGMQMVHDYMQIVLRNPKIMGKDTFARPRIEKICEGIQEVDDYFCIAFNAEHKEADKRQEEMDALLREIWKEDTQPFAVRYPYTKQYGYDKARKGWVD